MKATRKDKAQPQQQPATNLAEKALEVAIKIMPLESRMIKALRLTCKRTKVAANARVKQFEMTLDQEPEAVEHSGLLENITNLHVHFRNLGYRDTNDSRALGLLNLAVDVCSKSIKVFKVEIDASYHKSSKTMHACASILANCDWESVQELIMDDLHKMPGFLAGFPCGPLKPGSFPALKTFCCQNPEIADIEALDNSGFLDKLATLKITWSVELRAARESNRGPAMIAAMRNLLQNATNLERLHLASCTFEFFDSEQLTSLKSLHLKAMSSSFVGTVKLAPALARPWLTLESLHIESAYLRGPDLTRIFEAQDTLPVLRELTIEGSGFKGLDTLNNDLPRPYLEKLSILNCRKGHVLLSQLASLVRWNIPFFPSLREFCFSSGKLYDDVNPGGKIGNDDDEYYTPKEALSKFLSCPGMALQLETLSIQQMEIAAKGTDLLYDIADKCPKLKHLDLRYNSLKEPAVALLLGFGMVGAWPKLEKLGGVVHNMLYWKKDDPFSEILPVMTGGSRFMSKLNVQATLRRAWPGLECY